MSAPHRSNPILPARRIAAVLLTAALAALTAACATTGVDSQWRNVETPRGYLRGTTLLVTCDAPELAVKRLCEEQLIVELASRGARAVLPAAGPAGAAGGVADQQYLPGARELGARAIFSVTLGVGNRSVSPGVSLGLGSFGAIGRHVGAGLGVSVPIGGGQVSVGYAASSRVTDVASGRLMWTARASAAPSSDINGQLVDLSRSLVDAAVESGLF